MVENFGVSGNDKSKDKDSLDSNVGLEVDSSLSVVPVEKSCTSVSVCESESTPRVENNISELPTENSTKIIKRSRGRPRKVSDRMKTSGWVSRSIQTEFIDACKICGHNECSVEESLKSAFTQAVKRSILGKPIEEYPFKSISINIEVLKITPKYDKRGPKEKEKEKPVPLVCPVGGAIVRSYCINHCRPAYSDDCAVYRRFMTKY